MCWTPAAVASDVVNLQAARAQKARKLAPILLAPCTPPGNLGGRFRLADLSGWRGDPTDKEFIALIHALHGKLSRRLFSSGLWRSPYLSWGGAGAAALGAVALNNYRVELPAEDAAKFKLLLATRLDDKPMPVREKGPLFIIYPFDESEELRSERYYSRSAWQLRTLEVK